MHDKVLQNVLSSAPTNEWLDKQDEFGRKECMSDSAATRIPPDNKHPSTESNSDTDGVSVTKKPRATPRVFTGVPRATQSMRDVLDLHI